MASLLVPSERAAFTIAVAARIRTTGFRFDKTWRHADIASADMHEAAKAAFYLTCCTFAANDIADNPEQADHWLEYL